MEPFNEKASKIFGQFNIRTSSYLCLYLYAAKWVDEENFDISEIIKMVKGCLKSLSYHESKKA